MNTRLIKVAEATDHALDWLVAKAEGALAPLGNLYLEGKLLFIGVNGDLGEPGEWVVFKPSTDWAQGGPIIEREGIWISDPTGDVLHPRQWGALLQGKLHDTRGPTPLIAAMRCYVASKLGPEVEVPEELMA